MSTKKLLLTFVAASALLLSACSTDLGPLSRLLFGDGADGSKSEQVTTPTTRDRAQPSELVDEGEKTTITNRGAAQPQEGTRGRAASDNQLAQPPRNTGFQDEQDTATQPSSGLPSAKQHPYSGLRLPIGIRANIRAPLEPPVAQPEIEEFIEPGMLKVGEQIQPGLYFGRSPYPQQECRWERLKQPTLDPGSTLASNDVVERFFVEVKPTDGALYTTCPVARVKSMPKEGRMFTAFPPGTYLVGIDIPPGRYVFDADTTPTESNACVVQALAGFAHIHSLEKGVEDDLIEMEVWYRGAGRFFFEIPRSAIAIETRCYGRKTTPEEDARRPKPLRQWRRPIEPPPEGIQFFRKGEYTTAQMPPGMYKVFTDPESPFCTIIRYQGDKEVSYKAFYLGGYQEILEGDTRVVIDTDSCYVAPLDKLPKPAQDPSQVLYGAGMYIVGYDLPPGNYRIETAYLEKDECIMSINSKMAHSNFGPGETLGSYFFRHGEYFVEIKPTDVGVESSCVMERLP